MTEDKVVVGIEVFEVVVEVEFAVVMVEGIEFVVEFAVVFGVEIAVVIVEEIAVEFVVAVVLAVAQRNFCFVDDH